MNHPVTFKKAKYYDSYYESINYTSLSDSLKLSHRTSVNVICVLSSSVGYPARTKSQMMITLSTRDQTVSQDVKIRLFTFPEYSLPSPNINPGKVVIVENATIDIYGKQFFILARLPKLSNLYILDCERTYFTTNPDRAFSEDEQNKIRELILWWNNHDRMNFNYNSHVNSIYESQNALNSTYYENTANNFNMYNNGFVINEAFSHNDQPLNHTTVNHTTVNHTTVASTIKPPYQDINRSKPHNKTIANLKTASQVIGQNDLEVTSIMDIITRKGTNRFRLLCNVIKFFPGCVNDFCAPYCKNCMKFIPKQTNVCEDCKALEKRQSIEMKFNFQLWIKDISDAFIPITVTDKEAETFFKRELENNTENVPLNERIDEIMKVLLSPNLYLDCCVVSYSKNNITKYRLFDTSLLDLQTLKRMAK